ncbi:TetR/AcrR family transcriptional regulator [Peribacillus tepidiphilus]|uniref:TetR/AcrR family transcriptional regulator n=1 Tax=Peribacillus tepidiphilus TaxID=2652445 RepID=UPI001291946C|nr:TetR/AcrR family transcriptional regulator [Peribacillus tepidiphilus]
MNGFERRRQQKMEQIRHAALSLFTQFGVQKVNIQEIAKKANVSQVTIYNYFGSKDELVFDVIEYLYEQQLKELNEIIKSDMPFLKKVEQMIHFKMSNTKKFSPEFLKAILIENPRLSKFSREFTEKKMMPVLTDFFETGKKEGAISQDISLETMILFLNILSEGLKNYTEYLIDSEQKNRFTNEIIHMFFYGIVGKNEK